MAEEPGKENTRELEGELKAAVDLIVKGHKMTKLGTNHRKYQRSFYIDSKVMTLCYEGSKKKDKIQRWIPIRDIVEINVDGEEQNERGANSTGFTVVVGKDTKNLKPLIAPSAVVRDTWVKGLRHLVSVRSVDDPVQQERMWLEECFASADRNRDDLLYRDEIVALIRSLNVAPLDTDQVKSRMKAQKINFSQFVELYRELSRKRELEDLFSKYAGSRRYMSVNELSGFFQIEQKEEIPPDVLENIIRRSEPCPELKSRKHLSLAGFNVMFTSPRLNIKRPKCLTVYQDMTRPINHYFINSSHNTYLEGRQTHGLSQVDQYKLALSRGCRCVELDVWDGDRGQPIIYHGHTFTSKIQFGDVLHAINDNAFRDNNLPVIISLENHASEKQQARMAQLIRTIFKDRLYDLPLHQGDPDSFPSPDQLLGRVIIQGTKPSDDVVDDVSDDEDPGDVDISDADRQIHQEKKESKVNQAKALSDCVSFYQSEPFKNLDESSEKMSFLNISETKVGQCMAKDGGRQFVNFNAKKLSRVYPAWWRMSSSNCSPTPLWMAGCQVFAGLCYY